MLSGLRTISGRFFRFQLGGSETDPLAGAASRQGRYHHDAQAALYLSPRIDWAWKAAEVYLRSDEQRREPRQLQVAGARVVDIADRDLCRTLGIDPADSVVPWQPQIDAGIRPATWEVSDRSREAGADGLIYTARTAPERWHLVLFHWNRPGAPRVVIEDRIVADNG